MAFISLADVPDVVKSVSYYHADIEWQQYLLCPRILPNLKYIKIINVSVYIHGDIISVSFAESFLNIRRHINSYQQ